MTTQVFTGPRITAGPIVVDTDARTVRVDGRLTRQLTRKEFAVLMALVVSPTACVGRDRIVRQVWGPSHVDRSGFRTLDSHVMRLRAKLRGAAASERSGLVQNVHGIGYRLLPADPEED